MDKNNSFQKTVGIHAAKHAVLLIDVCPCQNRCYSKDGEEQTSIGQTSGGAREGHHSQGSDSLSFLQP